MQENQMREITDTQLRYLLTGGVRRVFTINSAIVGWVAGLSGWLFGWAEWEFLILCLFLGLLGVLSWIVDRWGSNLVREIVYEDSDEI